MEQVKARELLQRVYKILMDNGFKFMNTFGNETEGNIAYNDVPFPYDVNCTDYNIGRYFKTPDYFYIKGWDKDQIFGITTIYGKLFKEIGIEEENFHFLNKRDGYDFTEETLESTDVIVYSRTDSTFEDGRLDFAFIKQTDTDKEIKEKLYWAFIDIESDFWNEIHLSRG
jgi:hypothetical protein